ncbi:MAG TPA: chemotaxis protein CheX [Spirochaetota bacterium]|nr:chemotaxis protein CheX [Spirochaetota bacterium]HPH01890.1 chemotaxis protein CheX [Spirochaetota bacterium]
MKVEYINPFVVATQSVFRAMMNVEAVAGKPFLFDPVTGSHAYDISGIIGLSGETTGAVVLSFTKLCALKSVSAFSGMEIKIFDQTVVDAIGELINIIAGNAKKDLTDFKLNISLPSVVTGHSHRLNWPTGVPVIMIPFTSELGEFSISVSLREPSKR